MSEIKTSQQESVQKNGRFSFKAAKWVWIGLSVPQVLLGLRVMLKLIAANPDNPFIAFIYDLSSIFLIPFTGLISVPESGGMVLETVSIVAMLVYTLLAWFIVIRRD